MPLYIVVLVVAEYKQTRGLDFVELELVNVGEMDQEERYDWLSCLCRRGADSDLLPIPIPTSQLKPALGRVRACI